MEKKIIIGKVALAFLLSFFSHALLSIFFANEVWVDITITVIVCCPIYIKISDRLDVEVI